jgi:replication factor A3
MIQESHLTVNHAVEIIGKVQADLSVRVLTSTDFGENIGMDMKTKLC